MSGLTYCNLGAEEEYYKRFCEIYGAKINTPDGFCVSCKNLEETARHVCGGKQKVFKKVRACRIEWSKYILLHPEKRKILKDVQTGNLIFFFEKGNSAYAVVCGLLPDGELNLFSGFVVGGYRMIKYREGKPPYEFYKKSC